MKSLSYTKTNNIIQPLNSGKSYCNISIEHGVSKTNVYNMDLFLTSVVCFDMFIKFFSQNFNQF